MLLRYNALPVPVIPVATPLRQPLSGERLRPEAARRAHAAIATYRLSGIRLAFSSGVRDESELVMGVRISSRPCPTNSGKPRGPFVFFEKVALTDRHFCLFDELYDANTRICLAPC
jgi:hypothetical protein